MGTHLPTPTERGTAAPLFDSCLLSPNGWMDQVRIPLGTEVGLGPGDIALDGDPIVSPRKGAQQAALFGPLCSGMVAHLSNC